MLDQSVFSITMRNTVRIVDDGSVVVVVVVGGRVVVVVEGADGVRLWAKKTACKSVEPSSA